MGNLIIFTEGGGSVIENLAKTHTELDVRIINIDEVKNMDTYNPSVIVLDVSKNKLKEVSMITKFTAPTLAVCDDIPEGINVRAEAYDYIVNPVNEFEFSVKIKNLIKIRELKDRISNIATTDELTGLHNRKFLIERLEAEISRTKRYGGHVSCVLFDIDYFKVVNDMYGYEWGDILLKKIAEMLLALARKEDIVTRYGDEEFMVILPNTSEENAFIFAERFRRDVEKMQFVPAGEDENHPIRISGGISSFPNVDSADENANSLVRYAEHSLYNAKKNGKNRIIMFSQVNLDF